MEPLWSLLGPFRVFLLLTLLASFDATVTSPNKLSRPGLCFHRFKDGKVACTPDFFFIGASKAGTTSLAYYLQTHPMIMNINQFDPDTKEGHWFDSRAIEGMKKDETARFLDNFDGRHLIRGMVLKQPGFVINTGNSTLKSGKKYVEGGNLAAVDGWVSADDDPQEKETNKGAANAGSTPPEPAPPPKPLTRSELLAAAIKRAAQDDDAPVPRQKQPEATADEAPQPKKPPRPRDKQREMHYIKTHRPLMMDYTPNYLMHDEAPMLIRKTFADKAHQLKFIMCLREPVARTMSSWRAKRGKHEAVPDLRSSLTVGKLQGDCIMDCYNDFFDGEALKSSAARRLLRLGDGEADGVTIDEKHPYSPSQEPEHKWNKYDALDNPCSMKYCRRSLDGKGGTSGGIGSLAHVVKSMYAYQLLNWYHVFHPRQFCIVTLEEMAADPVATVERIVSFLGLQMYHDDSRKKAEHGEHVNSTLSVGSAGTAGGEKRNDDFINTIRTANMTISTGAELTGRKAEKKDKVKNPGAGKKGGLRQKQLKQQQLLQQKNGWDSLEQLLMIIRKVKNKTKPNPSLDSQITPEVKAELRKYFNLTSTRLELMLRMLGHRESPLPAPDAVSEAPYLRNVTYEVTTNEEAVPAKQKKKLKRKKRTDDDN